MVACMTLEQPDGFLDVDRPGGERIRLRFRGASASQPEVTAGLVQLLLDAPDGAFYDAVTAYADQRHLGAGYFLGTDSVIIEIYEPLTLKPLVNASGGSPGSTASRHPSGRVTRPLARLLRLRAPSG